MTSLRDTPPSAMMMTRLSFPHRMDPMDPNLNPNRAAGPYVIAACVSCINYGILIAISGIEGWTTPTWATVLRVLPGHAWTWAASFIIVGIAGIATVGNPRWHGAETVVCLAAALWLFIVGCFFVYSAFHDGTPNNAALAWFIAFVFGYYGAGTRRWKLRSIPTHHPEGDESCKSKPETSPPETS